MQARSAIIGGATLLATSLAFAGPAPRADAAASAGPPEVTAPAWEQHLDERRVAVTAPAAEEPLDTICEQLGTAVVPGGPCEAWVSRLPEHMNADASAIVRAPDGSRIYVTGSAEGPGGFPDADIVTVALDARTGAEVWTRTFGGAAGGYDATVPLQPMALSPDGGTVYVTGGSFTNAEPSAQFVTIAYDAATGAERWRSMWDGPGARLDFAYHVIPSPDGTIVYVGGDSGQPIGPWTYYDSALVALDAATGELLWDTIYADPIMQDDFADGLALSPDGERLYLTMGSYESCPECPGLIDLQVVTVAYRARGPQAAQVVWREVHRGAFNAPDRPRDVRLTPDGSTLVISTIASIPGRVFDYGLLAHDVETGERLWYSTYGTVDTELPNDLVLSSDGRTAFVTGYGTGGDAVGLSNRDFLTVATDVATGERRWVRQDSFDSQWWNNQPDEAEAVALTPDGSTLVVTGLSVGARYDDYWTIAYDPATGARRWSVRFDDQVAVDRPGALAVDGQRIYVSGSGSTFRPELQTWADELATVAYPLPPAG